MDHVDYLIAYAWHPASNARELVEYARQREAGEDNNDCAASSIIVNDVREIII